MQVNQTEALMMPKLFFGYQEFREKYLKLTVEDRVKLCKKEKFNGVETFRLLMDLMALSIQQHGDKVEGYDDFCDNTMGIMRTKDSDVEGIITSLFIGVDPIGDWKNQIHDKLKVMIKEWNEKDEV